MGRRRCAGAFALRHSLPSPNRWSPTPDADALRSTLESLLSVENLQVDSYLRGHLTSRLVPLAVLARCDRVVALGAAPPAIAEAARASTALRLDPSGTMAKPDVADKRNTLLLRDVPPEAQAEVRALFDAEGCPAPAELRAEAGGSWVVRFAEEEQCLDAVGVLRGRTLRGAEVEARVRGPPAFAGGGAPRASSAAAPAADDLAGAEPLRIAAAAAAARARRRSSRRRRRRRDRRSSSMPQGGGGARAARGVGAWGGGGGSGAAAGGGGVARWRQEEERLARYNSWQEVLGSSLVNSYSRTPPPSLSRALLPKCNS